MVEAESCERDVTERAQAPDPDSPWSLYCLGVLHYQRRDYGLAYHTVGKVLTRHPNHVASYELLADTMLRLERVAGASQSLRIALRKTFELWIGRVQQQLGDQPRAYPVTRYSLWMHHALEAARRLANLRGRRAMATSLCGC
ncbi:MAG: CDC27 family protein [Steroidobacteraceae bacterium]